MSREDWELFEAYRQEKRRSAADWRRAFSDAHASGQLPHFTKHCDTHYSAILGGDRLDVWPGPRKWRWRDVTYGPDKSLRDWLKQKEEEGTYLGT